ASSAFEGARTNPDTVKQKHTSSSSFIIMSGFSSPLHQKDLYTKSSSSSTTSSPLNPQYQQRPQQQQQQPQTPLSATSSRNYSNAADVSFVSSVASYPSTPSPFYPSGSIGISSSTTSKGASSTFSPLGNTAGSRQGIISSTPAAASSPSPFQMRSNPGTPLTAAGMSSPSAPSTPLFSIPSESGVSNSSAQRTGTTRDRLFQSTPSYQSSQQQQQFHTPSTTLRPQSTAPSSFPSRTPTTSTSSPANATTNLKPAETKLEGKFEHPALAQIQKSQRSNTFTEHDLSVLIFNSTSICFLFGFWAGGYYHRLVSFVVDYFEDAGRYMPFVYGGFVLLCVVNVGFALMKLVAPKPQFAKVPLTPRQRLLMGLDPNVKSASGGALSRPSPVVKSTSSEFRQRTPLSSRMLSAESTPYSTPLNSTRLSSNPKSAGTSSPLFSTPAASFSPTLGMSSPPIRDKKSLDTLLRESEQLFNPPQQQTPYSTPQNYLPPQLFSSGKFQTASPSTPSSSYKTPLKERTEGGLKILAPQVVLGYLNVEPLIDAWAENVRWWVAEKVVGPFVKRMEDVDRGLEAEGLGALG
ncbi:hypothetical protein HDV05_000952, partial [Chytridiales sp. JEL 0842]